MEILIGRITADAKVSTLKNERKVVNFSIAINDSYKSKESGQIKKMATFVNCSYWLNTAIAEYLTKGSLVEVCGRISVSAYSGLDREAKASLNFHVNNIKLHGKTAGKEVAGDGKEQEPSGSDNPNDSRKSKGATVSTDDLPF